MSRNSLCLIAIISLMSLPSLVHAQSSELPVPNLVVKDADGKVMGQVVGFQSGSTGFAALVVIDVDGQLGFFVFQKYGLVDRTTYDTSSGMPGGRGSVYFSEAGCVGTPYLNPASYLEAELGVQFGVAGPDPTTGEYWLYRSTSMIDVEYTVASKWMRGDCVDFSPTGEHLLPAEPVPSNPLAGYHGPTLTNPDRVLTLSGGDRLQGTP